MTSGMVVVLGETGQNFGAGMSSGVAYVLDIDNRFPPRCNTELVDLLRVEDPREAEALRTVIEWHARKTRSKRASYILGDWQRMQGLFWRVLPRETSASACDFVDSSEYDGTMMSASH
jgi:glutamate synthase domain-containing protein 3